jgi:membrane protein YqaA with SNARE-associated domain
MRDVETASPPIPARLGFFGRLRARVAALSRTPHAHAAMVGISVIDGSVFPIPPFALLVPMVLTEPRKWARYATTGALASVVGGLIGFAIGLFFQAFATQTLGFDPAVIDQPLRFSLLGYGVDFGTTTRALFENVLLLACLCSVLPTPYKVVAIGAGFVGIGLPEFLIASLIGRPIRFFLVSGAFAFFGEKARRYIRV